mmetsp:Transcript_7578/g.17227  ORF Transcript_7578/g.17227 Transcript_7578/m.17227 type:complete len:217 (-) Transcript_7578:103-753(-)
MLRRRVEDNPIQLHPLVLRGLGHIRAFRAFYFANLALLRAVLHLEVERAIEGFRDGSLRVLPGRTGPEGVRGAVARRYSRHGDDVNGRAHGTGQVWVAELVVLVQARPHVGPRVCIFVAPGHWLLVGDPLVVPQPVLVAVMPSRVVVERVGDATVSDVGVEFIAVGLVSILQPVLHGELLRLRWALHQQLGIDFVPFALLRSLVGHHFHLGRTVQS